MRRILMTVAMTFGLLMGTAAPASAHTVAGVGATNFRTRLTAVTPDLPGLEVRVIEAGSRLELRNTGKEEVVVLGYEAEPYLRVGPDGVFENRRSPATYLNANRRGTGRVPASADPAAPPEWRMVSDGRVARWHDHRVHWMGNRNPPPVLRNPEKTHVIYPRWTVDLRQGATPVVASGTLVWVPGPSPLPWAVLIVALIAAGVFVGRSRRWASVLSALVALLIAVDVIHSVGIAFAGAGTTANHLGRLVTGSLLSLPVWAVGVLAIRWLSRRDLDGTLAAAFAGVFIALLGGLSDLDVLSRSQVPFAYSPSLARLLVALSIGLGGAIVAASVVLLTRRPFDAKPSVLSSRPPPAPAPEPAPTPGS
jgi:hypothetical protein